jgi:hypothetical protein
MRTACAQTLHLMATRALLSASPHLFETHGASTAD